MTKFKRHTILKIDQYSLYWFYGHDGRVEYSWRRNGKFGGRMGGIESQYEWLGCLLNLTKQCAEDRFHKASAKKTLTYKQWLKLQRDTFVTVSKEIQAKL